MPTYDPNKTYIASVFDGILLKLRRSIDEFPDVAVLVGLSVGDPNGQIEGTPGDVRIDLLTPTIWQKITGEHTEFGWEEVGAGALGPQVVALLNAPFITYAADPTLLNARVATAGTNMSIDLTTPGQAIFNASGTTAATFSGTFETIGAAVATVPIADLPVPGAYAFVRSLVVAAIFTAGSAPGDIGQINYCGTAQAQNSTSDGVVVLFGPPPWGPPPGVPPMNSTGYQPPLTFGSPGGVAITLQTTGTQLEIQAVGIGGFTITYQYVGEIYVFGGAVRLHP